MKKILLSSVLIISLLGGCSRATSTSTNDLQSKIDKMQKTLADKDTQISDLETKNDDLTAENEELKTSNDDLQSLNTEYEDKIKDLTVQLEESNVTNSYQTGNSTTSSAGIDKDLDNDGVWDYNKGGTDRDTDGDGIWDYNKGGTDRDLDNDGAWDN